MRFLNTVYLTFCFTLLFVACSKKTANVANNLDLLEKHFDAATVGRISARDELKYVLKNPVLKADETKLQKAISLNPTVPGIVTITNGTLLTFKPNEALVNGQAYQVNIDMSQIDGSQEDIISYELNTIDQAVNIDKKGFLINGTGAFSSLFLVSLADKTSDENIKLIFSEVNKEDISVRQIDDLNYEVSITQNDQNFNKDISYDPKAIGGNQAKGSLSAYNLNQSAMDILDHHFDSKNKIFTAYFSQPIDPNQDLTGLVQCNGQDVTYDVKANSLSLFLNSFAGSNAASIQILNGLKGVKSVLKQDQSFSFDLQSDKPAVEFLSTGNYFPSKGNFKIPIKTRALKSIRVQVIEIPQTNVLQYLAYQSFSYPDMYNLRFVGRPIFDKDVPLNAGSPDINGWTVHGIDLSTQIKKNPGSIYHVTLDFAPTGTTLTCAQALGKYELASYAADDVFFKKWDMPYHNQNYFDDYNWEENQNPCDISYYLNRVQASRILICSDFGIIAKQASDGYHVAVNDLHSLEPVSGADIQLFDFQGKSMQAVKTDGKGFAHLPTFGNDALALSVKNGTELTYMKLEPNNTLDYTGFSINGERSNDEAEYYLYTERGVWRPGDNIFLDVMVNKSNLSNPDGVPIQLVFQDPENAVLDKQTKTLNSSKDLIYHFVLKTTPNGKTGRYKAVVKIGAQRLVKYFQVETIKPNLAATNFAFDFIKDKSILSSRISGNLTATYLTGAPMAGARVETKGRVNKTKVPFKNYADYVFIEEGLIANPNVDLFKTTTNEEGKANFSSTVDLKSYGCVLNLAMETVTIGKDGGSNLEGNNVVVYPFESYVGMKPSTGSGWSSSYTKDDKIKFDVVNLDRNGSGISGVVKVSLEKAQNTWWLDKYALSRGTLTVNDYTWEPIETKDVKVNSKATFSPTKLQPGAYKIIMTDLKSNHNISYYFNIDGYESDQAGGSNFLQKFTTNKSTYKEGEEMSLTIPTSSKCKVLVSIENGNKIIAQEWIDGGEGGTMYKTKVAPNWYPNAYINVSVILPFEHEPYDLPVRTYGVQSVEIEQSSKALKPVIKAPEKMEANQTYEIIVSEQEGRDMNYSFAIVDEGLLNITGFETPNPSKFFGGKLPLLVKTWDVYKDLIQYYSGQFAGIISIGGDNAYQPDAMIEVNRSKPVVIHQGVFKVTGGKNSHKISLPNYVGKIRVMVAACNAEGAFGNTQKTIPVRNPIMMQPQLPRSMYVGDKASIPILLTKDEANISSVTLKLVDESKLISSSATSSINLAGKNALTHSQIISAGNVAGKSIINFEISSGSKSVKEQREIAVNYPNSYATKSNTKELAPGASATFSPELLGYPEAYAGSVLIGGARVPNFTKYANELIAYPYGCLEQSTSAAFGQLYLDKLLELTPKEKADRQSNLNVAIAKLRTLQRGEGSFNYWPEGYYDEWADLYVGNFLVEAQKQGVINFDDEMLKKWLDFHSKRADITSSDYKQYQAYRLFILAKAGRSNKSALNRFTASNSNIESPVTNFLIAGAMKLSGFDSKATEFIKQAESVMKTKPNVERDYYYYSSDARDKAMMVEVLSYVNQSAMPMYYNAMVDALNKNNWSSTQEKGYACLATHKYLGGNAALNKPINFVLEMDGKSQTVQKNAGNNWNANWKKADKPKKIVVQNTGNTRIYISLNDKYIPTTKVTPASNKGLELEVIYYNATKGKMGLDDVALGDNITITATVNNPNALPMQSMALNIKAPAGLEIINPNINGQAALPTGVVSQSYLDDKVYTFFNLPAGGSFRVNINTKAAFKGNYFVPSVKAEHMYNADIFAQAASGTMVVN